MNKKTNYILRLILGMYLTFLGINLIRETLVSHPSDLAFKIFMGIIFIVIGAGYAIWIIKRMIASKKAKQEEQKREEAAEAALRKMEQRRERVIVQSRTAPMPSKEELEASLSGATSIKDTASSKDEKLYNNTATHASAKETVVKPSVSIDIDDTQNEEENDYEEK